MRKAKRWLPLFLAAVFMFSAVSAACAADAAPEITPIPGGSLPVTVKAGTTVQAVLKRLDLPEGWVGADAASREPLEDSTIAATGMVVHSPGMEPTIVVQGDVLGTGQLGISQLVRLALGLIGTKPLTGAYLSAGDLNENGKLDLTDLTLMASLLITGHLPNSSKPVPDPTDAMEIVSVTRTALQDPRGDSSASAKRAAEGANQFAFRLSSALLETKSDSNENFVCSPYSVWLPLAALLNATDEQTRPELLEALGAAGLTAEDVNSAASRMLYGLTACDQNEWLTQDGFDPVDPLKIANALFVDRNETVKQAFASTFANDYLGDCILTDFSSSEAVDAVNQWCSDNTEGLIPEIIKEFDPATKAAIANAIYFSDRWKNEFRPEDTTVDVFHAPSGDVRAPFMTHSGDVLPYYEDDNLQAVQLPFATEGGLAILLPKDSDADGLLRGLTEERFSEIVEGASHRGGTLRLPRFDIESGVMNLNSSLEALGVPLLDGSNPAITELLENPDPLFISQALQSATIKVDEKGTTAAAVTIMAMEATGAYDPGVPFEMTCDSPFVFVLYGRTYDAGAQVLFTGTVNQPEIAA